MRYLHVLESFRAGSAETTFLHMLRAFAAAAPGEARESHDVLAFATGPLHREFAQLADRVIVATLPMELTALLTHDYDVIHLLFERCAHRLAPLALAVSDASLVYSKQYDAPALHRVQGHFDFGADESMLSAADAVTFTTLNLAAGYRLPPGRATILRKAAPVAGAFDVPALTASAVTASAVAGAAPAGSALTELSRPPRVLCAANLYPRKRLADLVPIMTRVRERVPDAELRIVGDGTPAQLSALTDLVADAGLSRAVQIAAPRAELTQELADARVFVLPSGSEGVPTVVLEAMAAARPVVATRVGHIGHILTNGCEGFLVQPGDVEAFAAHVAALLEQPALAARMGGAGRVRAAAHDVRGVALDLLGVLRRAATVRRKAA
jgi:glycosyltransferase involved in cell wall biosynthesis